MPAKYVPVTAPRTPSTSRTIRFRPPRGIDERIVVAGQQQAARIVNLDDAVQRGAELSGVDVDPHSVADIEIELDEVDIGRRIGSHLDCRR